jgi:hypothetical protein
VLFRCLAAEHVAPSIEKIAFKLYNADSVPFCVLLPFTAFSGRAQKGELGLLNSQLGSASQASEATTMSGRLYHTQRWTEKDEALLRTNQRREKASR